MRNALAFVYPSNTHAGAAQPGCDGGGLPVTEGDPGAQALHPSAVDMLLGKVGGCRSLVDEDQSVKGELAIEPRFALLQNIGVILFDRVAGFLRVIPCRARSASSRHRIALAALTPNRSCAFNRSNNTGLKITR